MLWDKKSLILNGLLIWYMITFIKMNSDISKLTLIHLSPQTSKLFSILQHANEIVALVLLFLLIRRAFSLVGMDIHWNMIDRWMAHKAHKANDASSWWWNDCMMMLSYNSSWLTLLKSIFTEVWRTDWCTDRWMDRPSYRDARMDQVSLLYLLQQWLAQKYCFWQKRDRWTDRQTDGQTNG